MGDSSIKKQFIVAFTFVLTLSFLATLLVCGAVFWVINTKDSMVRPANYYEKQMPMIKKYVEAEGVSLLAIESRAKLERVIPEAIKYQVVDKHGRIRYGTLQKEIVRDGRDVVNNVNRVDYSGGIYNTFPVIDKEGTLQGAVILQYFLEVSPADPAYTLLVKWTRVVVLLSPFIFIFLFTLFFGKRFSRKIGGPIQQLIDGAQRIKERDLAFSLSYQGTNELARLTQAFEEMRSELESSLKREWRLEQERREMVAAIAHDLQTPLTIIQGHVEGLQEGGARQPERLNRYLATIEQNAKRATRLIEEMNIVSELEKAEFHLNMAQVDMEAFVAKKAEAYALMCKQKEIRFAVNFADERREKREIYFDPYRMAQVLDNLLSNSLRFTPEQGMIAWQVEMKEDVIRMHLYDSGPGFPENEEERVFQKFYQGDASRSKGKGNAGLGLYIARVLVERHGGTIEARNQPEGGACVSLAIPLRRTLNTQSSYK